jgi:hypothetical protein
MSLRYTVNCDALFCCDSVELVVIDSEDLPAELQKIGWVADDENENTHYCPEHWRLMQFHLTQREN